MASKWVSAGDLLKEPQDFGAVFLNPAALQNLTVSSLSVSILVLVFGGVGLASVLPVVFSFCCLG